MAGTFTDKATLATDNAFINKCRAAMLFRAVELISSATAQKYGDLSKMASILQNAGAEAPLMAWRVAAGNPTIGAAAPAVPNDSDTQFAVNTFLALV
jgi:hypothetical protein